MFVKSIFNYYFSYSNFTYVLDWLQRKKKKNEHIFLLKKLKTYNQVTSTWALENETHYDC